MSEATLSPAAPGCKLEIGDITAQAADHWVSLPCERAKDATKRRFEAKLRNVVGCRERESLNYAVLSRF